MKKAAYLGFLLAALTSPVCPQQNTPNRQAGVYIATAYNYDIDSSFYSAFGPYTFTRTACTNAVSLGTRALDPFNVNASVLVTDSTPGNTETAAFISQNLNGGLCILSLAVAHPHVSYHLSSGTFGLQEAINDATQNGGGNIVLDTRWHGNTGMITGAAGNVTVAIQDNRSGAPASYVWNGSSYALQTTNSGLNDPGSNGPVKRTALNVTAPAGAPDITGLFSGTCDASHALFGNGTCQAIASGAISGSPTIGTQVIGNGAAFASQPKPVYDLRDQTSCGSVDDTTVFSNLLTAIGSTQVGMLLSCQMKLSNVTIPANVTLDASAGGSIFVVTGQTVTIKGPINAVPRQIFFNIASGQGSLSFSGNKKMTTYSPLWFGLDCSGVGDNTPIWNQILAFTGDDVTMVLPIGCVDMHASTVTVTSRSGFKLTSQTRMQNGGGNVQPVKELWTGSTGGMWDFQANQGAIVDGLFFTNTGTAHVDYFLRFDGNPSTYIGTEDLVRYNTFTNNMANPTIGGAGSFDAITINTVSGQNHEKNVITDNDFFCSQARAFRESDSTQINNGSATVTCGLGNCTYTTDANVGDRLRVSYATGIFDTTVQSITDNNHLVATSTFSGTSQTNARLHFRQAYGNGITIGSVNSKHNTIDRNSFTQCARGINMTNGSFSLEHIGGSANDVLLYINDTAEPTHVNYVEDESTLRDVYTGPSMDGPLIMSHLRNSLGIAGEFDGFIYFSGGVHATILESEIQDTPEVIRLLSGWPLPATSTLQR
jgi:hypothetical protein